MDKKIEVCTGNSRNGSVSVRLSLILMDGGKEVFEHFHRVDVAADADAAQARASVEADLASSTTIPFAPWPAIPDEEWDKALGVMAIFRTPEKVLAAQEARIVAARRVGR